MATNLTAAIVYTQNEDVLMVGFADDEYEPKDFLLLQKSTQCNEQDKMLGLDKVNICYRDQLCSQYGGIHKCVLKKSTVEIFVDNKTSLLLGTDELIQIDLPNGFEEVDNLFWHLQKLFCDDPKLIFERCS